MIRIVQRLSCAAFLGTALPVHADVPADTGEIQVTATREAEPADAVPASITVISGRELIARGANDLRTALALAAGVQGSPGGDGGPGGATPALWGLREIDAFLLVIDGVPVGGAFVPVTSVVDLTGVERIEIIRGAAPVMYGATSFSGVIHVIHYAPGSAKRSATIGAGSEGGVLGSVVFDLPAAGSWKHSLSVSGEKRAYDEDRVESRRAHVLYRAATDLDFGRLTVDGEFTDLPQKPSSGLVREGTVLRNDIPDEANHNPADAKLDTRRYGLTSSLAVDTSLGAWTTMASWAHTRDDIVRGFLVEGAADDVDPDAVGYRQDRHIDDVYVDTYLLTALGPSARLTYGADLQYGDGDQDADRFTYRVDLDGSNAERSDDPHFSSESAVSSATRTFWGLYAQLDWKAAADVDVLAGLRLNRTREKVDGRIEEDPRESGSRTHTRLSGMVGASWTAWRSGTAFVRPYADYRNTFKPIAFDFGPESEGDLLEPETSNSYEVGVKSASLDGRLDVDLSLFRLDFKNLRTLDTEGELVNAGKTRFEGVEVESRYRIVRDVLLTGTYAYHDARLVRFNRNGTPGGVVDGNSFELSPFNQFAVGALYLPAADGPTASLTGAYTGPRKLNKSNTVEAGGYMVWDVSIGWRRGACSLALNGYNLGDARGPVSESELAEATMVPNPGGDDFAGAPMYYRQPGRTFVVQASMDF